MVGLDGAMMMDERWSIETGRGVVSGGLPSVQASGVKALMTNVGFDGFL